MRVLAMILGSAAAANLISARLYHFVEHPEWTEPQALRELWLPWTLGILLAAGAVAAAVLHKPIREGDDHG